MRVLAGILPARKDNLHFAFQHLEAEHFRDNEARTLWALVEGYYNLTGGLIGPDVLANILERRGTDPAKALVLEESLRESIDTDISDHEFRYSVDALRDLREQQLTGEAITSAFEILERGLEVDKREMKGHDDARQFLYERLGHIDRLGSAEAAPEGDMRLETDEILEDYANRKGGKFTSGIMTGIGALDRAVSGHQPGDLALYCAYTSQGKSMMMAQLAWHAAIVEGRNVFLATSETIRIQYMRRLAARHSRLPAFGCPDGLNTKDIKNGTLTPPDEEVYRAVLEDLRTNPEYGKLYVTQIPRDATLSYIEARMNRQQQLWHIDLVGIDYLNLVRPDVRRQSQREEANEIIKGAKLMATSFDGGRGIPIISPWQMSQNAYKGAMGADGRGGTGGYSLASLAETSEAEKSSDLITALLRYPETPRKALLQVLKARDDAIPSPIELSVDYRCAYLGERDEAAGFGEAEDEYGLAM